MGDCVHIREFRKSQGIQAYKTIYYSFIARKNHKEFNYHAVTSACFDCERYNNMSRLFICLSCVYIGCHEKHSNAHAVKQNHILKVELSNGNVFCSVCSDNVYDKEIDNFLQKQRKKLTTNSEEPWRPSISEIKILQEHPGRVRVEPHSNVGIRGLISFGSSCYLNVIMQALFHTPMLRDYIFSDKHECSKSESGDCFFCLISRQFQQYYSNDRAMAMNPYEVYSMIWKSDQNLAGNSHKDPHEFFTTTMNLLHKFASPSSNLDGGCKCIVDLLFYAKLQSDVVCKSCGNISTRIETYRDISLEIPNAPVVELLECLRYFTKAESLHCKIECNSCDSNQFGTKQLTFRILPLVLVLHLKRFEQVPNTIEDTIPTTMKKSMRIPFPMELNMTPFVSGYRNRGNTNNHTKDGVYDDMYTLYAVVEHIGTNIEGGHLVSYIRHTRHSWYKCDDHYVIPVSVDDVLNSEGYMLFYHKSVLMYE